MAVICVIVAVGGGLYVQADAKLTSHQQERLAGSADVQDDTIDEILSSKRQRTTGLASAAERIRLLTPSQRGLRTELLELLGSAASEPFVDSVHYANASGYVEVTTEASVRGQTLAGAGYDTTLGNETTVQLAPETRTWTVTAPSGQNHYVTLVVNASAIADEVDGLLAGTTTRIVNSDGVVVFSANASEIGTQYVEGGGVDSPAVETGLGDAEGATTLAADEAPADQRMVAGYDKIDGTDWALVSTTTPSQLYGFANTVGMNILLTLVAGALAVVGFALVVERPTLNAVRDLSQTAARVRDGDLDVDIESERRDEIGDLYATIDEMRDSLRERLEAASEARDRAETAKQEANEAREEAMDAKQAAQEQSERLRAEAGQFADTMGDIADGDLTARLDATVEEEAFETIQTSFNEMMDELHLTVQRTQQFATDVATVSDTVLASAEEIASASDDISSSLDDISTDAQQQAGNLQAVAGEMSDLSATVEEIASSTDEVAATSERAAARGREGTDAAHRGLDEMEAIQNETDALVEEIEALEREVAQIGDIVHLITDIAEQTNMLALNASIEAARASDGATGNGDGEGFAVVADEIKALAGEAADAAQDIENHVDSIRDSTAETVTDMQAASERVADGAETVEHALEALEDIVAAVEDADAGLQEINSATDEQADSAQQVVSMVEDVTTLADETATEADDASAAAEQQTTAVDDVTGTLETLADDARDLQRLIDEFEVERPADGAATPVRADGQGDD